MLLRRRTLLAEEAIEHLVGQQFVPERAAAEDQDVLSGLAFEFGDSSARSRTKKPSSRRSADQHRFSATPQARSSP